MKTQSYLAWLCVLALAVPATAQEVLDLPPPGEERLFGFEFEFAGQGNRVVNFESMPWENYERLMRVIVEHHGGNPADIQRIDFTVETTNLERYPSGERELFRAEWTDTRGRKWKIEPEFVASTGYDGYELVTPPLEDTRDLRELLEKIRDSGLVREGLKSGVHLNIDGRRLVQGNDARALANLIIMHENMEPMLRRLFNPVRGGAHANRFSRSLAVDHEDLLREIDRLPPEERTAERLAELFTARNGLEAQLHEIDPMEPKEWSKLWKYRSMNLAKVLQVNDLHNGRAGVVEFRMFDLEALSNPEAHRLQADLYRAMVRHAERLAAEGKTVEYQGRKPMIEGEDWTLLNTPEDPREAQRQARAMLESLGLDPAKYESLIGNRLQHRVLPTVTEFRGMVDALPKGRVEHNGRAFTYGFELEGTGEGFALIARPKDATVNARWDAMSDAEKRAYFRQVVGDNRRAVPQHFDLDLQRYPWLFESWKVEGTGNWEIRSNPFESLAEATEKMRLVKQLTGKSGKGFHLHMRDNGVDWEMLEQRGSEFADFVERSSNWVWLERARRLGTMTSMKSWSNNRFTPTDLENVANMKSSGRHTVRTTVPASREYIDIEIRGFTKFVDDIERLASLYTEALRTGNFGPWKHTDNMLPNNEGLKTDLNLERNFVEYERRVEGVETTPEMRRVIDGLQNEYINRADGTPREYHTNVATPLLPWEVEASIPEGLRRELKYKRDAYLRSLRFTANKVMNGDYGLDLNVASEQALVEKLGLTPETARALVEYRRAVGGELGGVEDVTRVLALGAATGDLQKAARLSALDTQNANAETLQSRLGVSEAQAKALIDFREAHDVVEALERAGVSEARILELIDRAGGLNLNAIEATAERMVEVLGISPEAAERIVEFRSGHEVTSEADMRRAGLSAEAAEQVLEVVTRTTNLSTAQPEDLQRLGLSPVEVEAVQQARQPHYYRGYEEVLRAGVSQEVADKLAASREVGRRALNTLSAQELVEKAGIELVDAERIVAYREARDMAREGELERLFGEERAQEIRGRANGFDLRTVTQAELVAEGVAVEDARRLVEYRDVTEIGGRYWDAGRAAQQLLEAGLVSEAEAERIRNYARELTIESVNAERLVEQLNLDPAVAKQVVEYRDAHRLTNAEALVEAGLMTQAEAERFVRLNQGLELRNASRADLVERGLTEVEADRLKGLVGTSLETASAQALADYTELDPRQAERLVLYRDRRSLTEALEALGKGDLAQQITEQARGAELERANSELSLAEMGRRLNLDPRTVKRILTYRDAQAITQPADLQRAGLGSQALAAWQRVAHNVDLNTASVQELQHLTISRETAEKIVRARQPRLFENFVQTSEVVGVETVRALQNSGISLSELNSLGAQELAERAGISPQEARAIVGRRTPPDMTERSVLVELLGPELGQTVYDRGRYNNVDLSKASDAELRLLGLSDAEAKALVEARTAHAFTDFTRLIDVVDLTTMRALQNSGITLEQLNSLGVEALAEKGGIELETARRLVQYRDALDVNARSVLKEVLPTSGEKLYARSQINLSRDGETKLAEVLGERAARRIINFRDAHGNSFSQYQFDAERLARELVERGVVQQRTGDKIAERAGELKVESLTLEQLTSERFGLSERLANQILRTRDAHTLKTTTDLRDAIQLDARSATALLESTGESIDLRTATYEQLVERGMPEAEARSLVEFREKAGSIEGLDYTEITRQVRFKVKQWAQQNELSEALLRSLLPRAQPGEVRVASAGETTGEGFGRTRQTRGATTLEVTPGMVERVGEIFAAVKEGAEQRLAERMVGTSDADRDALERGRKALTSLQIDIDPTSSILARLGEDGRIKISAGLLNEIDTRAEAQSESARELFRARVLALILGHEVAHGSGIRAERVADAEGLKILESSRLGSRGVEIPLSTEELRETVRLFDKPTGASHVDNLFNRLRGLFRYGTVRGREANLAREARGEADPLARYRRADGTLKWRSVIRDRALHESQGLAHFALALFLKEVAVVAATGDRARIEEFFDGLMTTDFYKHYGLFVVGARAGEVAYTRYLQRYVKPRFVNGVLKTNLVLATGIALPQLVDGTFEGKAFAITLGSLGLSSAAVKAGMSRIKWVVDLSKVKETRALQRLAGFRRLARFGGWFYTAAELAVVLWGAEELEGMVHTYLDRKAAREGIAKASSDFLDAVTDPAATVEQLQQAAETYHVNWIDYRNFLYAPLMMDEEVFSERLGRVARDAKRTEDARTAMLRQLESNPGLAQNVLARHASLEAYAASLTAEADADVNEQVDTYMQSYTRDRDEHMRQIYEDNRRDGRLLDGVDHLAWSRDPELGGAFFGIGSRTNRGKVVAKIEDASLNRLQTYEDELEVIGYAIAQMRELGLDERADKFAELSDVVRMTHDADHDLYHGEGVVELEADPALVDPELGEERDQETEAYAGLRAAVEELVEAYEASDAAAASDE